MRTIRLIYSLLTPPERRSAAGLLALMIAAGVLEAFGVGLVVPALAILLQPDPTQSLPALRPMWELAAGLTRSQIIAAGMAFFVVVYLVKGMFLTFVVWKQNNFVFALHTRLSQRLFQIYLRQPYPFHLQRNSAQLIHHAVTQVGELAFNGLTPAMMFMTETFALAAISVLLVIVQPIGAVAVGITLGVAAWLFQWATHAQLVKWGRQRPHHESQRIHQLQQGLGGAKEVKLLGREEDFLAQHHFHASRSSYLAVRYQTVLEMPRFGLELLGVIGLALLVFIMLGQGGDTSGVVLTLGLFGAAAFRLMPSVNRLVGSSQRLRYVGFVVDTLYAELMLPAPDAGRPARHAAGLQADIRLEQVGYTYPAAAAPALHDVCITVARNECVGFIGPSGSGKSTLVDVILGLLTPDTGRILVDGGDIQGDLRRWQDQVGYVPQAIYLTDDTIRRNVAFGLADDRIDNAAVDRAIRSAQLDAFVSRLPDGLETVVGERGIRLSGGERQRIGIARALYHDPAVLVLDEATSALDTATESLVMQAVMALRRTKTILVIAHRLSTVEHCDRLYRLEHGRVTAEGSSADVLRVENRVTS